MRACLLNIELRGPRRHQCAATAVVQVAVEGSSYHSSCFKCTSGCTITTANFKTHQGKLFCKAHFDQLFMKSPFTALQSPGEEKASTGSASPASVKENAASVDTVQETPKAEEDEDDD